MAGKPVGEFSLKMVTLSIKPGPAGSVINEGNFEGTATGYGVLFLTASFIGGAKDGTFSLYLSSFLENGDGVNGIGQGTYESTGKNRWRTQAVTQISDGRRVAGEGEIDLASRSWKGKLSELG